MAEQVLVAGVGNIFFRDDGFGPAVAATLLKAEAGRLPPDARVVDYGIRGVHLTYDLLSGVSALVLVDAVPGDHAGTVTVREVDRSDLGDGGLDVHGMQPVAVLASLEPMGGTLPPTYVVGCVPDDISEGIGLSGPVAAAVDDAADIVAALVHDLCNRLVRPGIR